MSCRLRVDRELGPAVLKALREAGHDADQVSGLLAARGAPVDEVFARAGLAGRVFVTADPRCAEIGRFGVADSPGLVLFCLEGSTLDDAVDSVHELQWDVLQDVRRAVAEVAVAAKRLELQQTQLKDSSRALYRRARRAITAGDREAARSVLAMRRANYDGIRALTEQWQELDQSERTNVRIVHRLHSAVEVFRTETEVMKADAVGTSDKEKSDVEALTAKLIEALAAGGVPHGALWLVLPNAIWEIPGPYLKGPADVSPRPCRRDAGRGCTDD
jgi:hypothetical protein